MSYYHFKNTVTGSFDTETFVKMELCFLSLIKCIKGGVVIGIFMVINGK